MADLVTLARLFLLFVLVVNAYSTGYPLLINLPLVVIIFVLDGVDGYVARKRHEESLFGAIFDIAADRIVENVLWLILIDLDLVPFWVPLVFITRSLFVDSIRSHVAAMDGKTPFGMMRYPLGRFLVSGRFMRIFYAALKAVAFGYIFFFQPWPAPGKLSSTITDGIAGMDGRCFPGPRTQWRYGPKEESAALHLVLSRIQDTGRLSPGFARNQHLCNDNNYFLSFFNHLTTQAGIVTLSVEIPSFSSSGMVGKPGFEAKQGFR